MRQFSSLERGLAILSEISRGGSATVEEVSANTGIPLSTSYRYMRQLVDSGFVEEQKGGSYSAGAAVLALAGPYVIQAFLAQIGPAFLRTLVDALGETVVLLVRVGTQAVCLRRAEPDKALKYTFAVDELLPLHAGAGQRVLLAYAPRSVISQVLGSPMPMYTSGTLGAVRVREEIARTRQLGYAVSLGELDPGSVSVAAPVFFRGEVVCSLNAAGPDFRCGNNVWIANAKDRLTAAASDISRAIETWLPAAPTRGPHDLHS